MGRRRRVAFGLALLALSGGALLLRAKSAEEKRHEPGSAPPGEHKASPVEIARLSPKLPRSTGAAEPVRPPTEELYWRTLEDLRKTDKAQALAYALAGEEWYSDQGRPAEARKAMIVTLLTDLGRYEEARARTRLFLEQYPQSPYKPLVQGVSGIHPRPGPPPGH